MNRDQSTTPKVDTIIASQRDYSKSGNWAFELEISTQAERKEIHLNLSGAEILLDALSNQRQIFIKDLEYLQTEWSQSDQVTVEQIRQSASTGQFARLVEQIKVCDCYIDTIASHVAANLREIGHSIPDSTSV